jgi:predicted outer membrane repeat protein
MTDGDGGESGGGAMANWGNDLTLTSVVLTGNSSTASGGAILSQLAQWSGSLEIIDSEISDNTTGDEGGGIAHIDAGDLTITNSIISTTAHRNRACRPGDCRHRSEDGRGVGASDCGARDLRRH